MEAIEVVRHFVEAMNRRDVEAMAGWMSPDHVLIDGEGDLVAGGERLRAAWKAYFSLFPDYAITIEEIFAAGDSVAVFGTAEGTYAPDGRMDPTNHWTIPAAWLAVLKGESIASWQVYAGTEPIRRIMARYREERSRAGEDEDLGSN
ncbi:MAG: nuclear transport factor 2 family protein [Acidobacteria bacterium]|jgi:uncharacterized protein (TIGR02246 family)|nr:nuclear transport factor 2 family protein [Acidobacteriota bacterium]